MQKWRFFESDTVSLREVWNKEDNKQSEMFEGKLKTFKNWPICAKHTIFTTESSREKVARASCQNTQNKNLKTNFLSVFCDWKFYSRESHEVSHENLWALSWLDLPPANKSPDWVARNIKSPNFEKYFKYFSRLGHWPASESRKISVWTRDWDMRLDQLVTESPKQGNTVFWNFDIFCKNKRLSKNS